MFDRVLNTPLKFEQHLGRRIIEEIDQTISFLYMRMYPIWRPGYTFHYQSFQVSGDVHTVNLNI